jgi:hypothetical protein
MAHRNRWFTELKNGGSFHGELLNNQMVYVTGWWFGTFLYISVYFWKIFSQLTNSHFSKGLKPPTRLLDSKVVPQQPESLSEVGVQLQSLRFIYDIYTYM